MYKRQKYYIQVSDSSFYKKPKAYQVSYPTVAYENVVMIPSNMIYHETSKKNASEYDYVWLLKDDEIIKQYVTLGDSDKSGDSSGGDSSGGDSSGSDSGADSGLGSDGGSDSDSVEY